MSRISHLRHAAGVSLIELMVALLMGSILVLGLVEVFAASRTSYQLSAGLARVQENGRFAMDYLQRDLRMAGHLGCVNDQARFMPQSVTTSRPALVSTFLTATQQQAANYAAAPDPLRFDAGMQGFDAKLNGGGAQTVSGVTITLKAVPDKGTTAGNWTPAVSAQLWTDLTAGAVGHPIQNSDIVMLRFFAPRGAQVKGFTPGTSAIIKFDNSQKERLTEGVTNPGLFGITDCINAAVFEATTATFPTAATTDGTLTVAASGANQSTFRGLQTFTIGQSMLYRAESVAYYVGLNANNTPALYRLRYTLVPGASAATPVKEELVEGIESLQLQYGLDSKLTATDRPTGNIGQSLAASAVQALPDPATAWRRVGLVQVGLLARSPEPAAAAQRSSNAIALSPLGITISAPNDTRYRAVYEDSVALRNRLFGN